MGSRALLLGITAFNLICLLALSPVSWADGATENNRECVESLGQYVNRIVILDANVVMSDPDALNRFPGARIIVPATLLEELDNNKSNLAVGKSVREYVRILRRLLNENPGKSDFPLSNGSTISLDSADHSKILGKYGFDKEKADNSGYLAVALSIHKSGQPVLLVTDDNILQLKAAAVGVQTEGFRSLTPANAVVSSDDEIPLFEINDDEMLMFLETGEIPRPEKLDIRPNEFVQFFSRTYPPAHETIARYQFRRPEVIFDVNGLSRETLNDGSFQLRKDPFHGTIRVFMNNDPVPELESGKTDGWYWDSSENMVVFMGRYRSMLYKQTSIKIEAQVRPHRMLRLKSFSELGLWSLHSRSLEQTMAMNLALDPSIDAVIMEGKHGSSKTFNSVAAASKLFHDQLIKGIVVSRAPTPMGGHNTGFLPGDSEDKNLPWVMPLLEQLGPIDEARTGAQRKPGIPKLPNYWEVIDYGHLRGLSINKLALLDEFQNTPASNVETVMGRLSIGGRFFITGDSSQIDPPLTHRNNGLSYLIELLSDEFMTDEQRSRVAILKLRRSVRSPFGEMISQLTKRHPAPR